MEINNDSLNLFSKKFYFILNSIIPGFFCMDAFFHFGLFSKTITNVYELILLLFWAILLSIPFSVVISYRIENFIPKLLHEVFVGDENDVVNKVAEDDDTKSAKEIIELIYNIARLTILFIIFNLVEFLYVKSDYTFLLFTPCIMIFIISFILLTLLEPILSRIYIKILRKLFISSMKERGEIQ